MNVLSHQFSSGVKTRKYGWAALALSLLLVSSCTTIEFKDTPQGTEVLVEGCDGMGIQVVIRQDPYVINERVVAQGGGFSFNKGELDNIDFSRSLYVEIQLGPVPAGADCEFVGGERFAKRFTAGIPPKSSGPFETVYEVDISDLDPVP